MPGLLYYLFKGFGYIFYGIFWIISMAVISSIYAILVSLYITLMIILFPFVVLFTGNYRKFFASFKNGMYSLTNAFFGRYMKKSESSGTNNQITDKSNAVPQLTENISNKNSTIIDILHCPTCGEKITREMQAILQSGDDCFCEFCGQLVRLPE